MIQQNLTPEQEELVKQLLPTDKEQEILFDEIYADSAFEDKSDQIMRLGAFKKGMKALRSLDLMDKPEIIESGIILELSQKITDLKKQLQEKENALCIIKTHANERMLKLEKEQQKNHQTLEKDLNKKLKSHKFWIIGGSIAIIMAMIEFVIIVTKI